MYLGNQLLFAKVNQNAIIPTKEVYNAGFDIYACFEDDYMVIEPLETRLVPTGVACAMDKWYYGQIQERGSTGSKGIKYGAGVIDSSYRGEIFIPITNCNNVPLVISKNDTAPTELIEQDYVFIKYPYEKAIAQMVILPVPRMEVSEITYDELKNIKSERGTGALGSSGK